MTTIRLIHWNSKEATEKAALLRGKGYRVVHSLLDDKSDLRALRIHPPDAVVIDLSRIPSKGRDIALFLRQAKATRHVPLIFADGEPEKVERIREYIPDAYYTDWKKIRKAVEEACANLSGNPVVPRSVFAPYERTPLVRKLGIRENMIVALVGPPPDFDSALDRLPEGVLFHRSPKTHRDLTLMFNRTASELRRNFNSAVAADIGTPIWILWPKKSSGIVSGLSQGVVRRTGLASGFVDYKICSFDATWSGLLFVRRKD